MDLIVTRLERRSPRTIWVEVTHSDGSSLTEDQADAIMHWTMDNQLGLRMAFQTWRFKSEADLTAFVLKWC